jgi:release factor glutamine methyltransferase
LGIAARLTLGYTMTLPSIMKCLQQSSQLDLVSDTPRLDVEIILAHVLKKERSYLFTWPERVLVDVELALFTQLFERRMTGEPIAHIVGVREFWSLELMVDKSTLIPRPDTELLVELALNIFETDSPQTSRRLLDLGTGTGAIALALAHEKKIWSCVAVDKEISAVELAEKNRVHLQLTNVKILQSDWFSALVNTPPFDIILSNPPYIDVLDPHLKIGDVRFEPTSALIAKNKGLADLELIISEANRYLLPGGWLLVEHGYDQAKSVRDLFEANSFRDIRTERDLGDNERVTLGRFQ